jgi:branched-chain amino acid transport system ATP-binding protein
MIMLCLKNIQVNYGAAPALWDISLDIGQNELISVIGPNGAGKTTLINTIMGLNRVKNGQILWHGDDITSLPSHLLCEKGIALVPESRRLFTSMTVLENLELGAMHSKAKARRAQTLEWVCELFPVVKQKLSQASGTLSGGQQQMVAIGRALMALPELLLLDEPSLGLAPSIVTEMFRVIQTIHREGKSVLLVEQNVSRALSISSRTYVLENGHVVAQGDSTELSKQDDIKKAYLGL